MKFEDTVYSLFPEDPSISLSPGPADGAERYLQQRDNSSYLSDYHQHLRIGSRQEGVKLECSYRNQQVGCFYNAYVIPVM